MTYKVAFVTNFMERNHGWIVENKYKIGWRKLRIGKQTAVTPFFDDEDGRRHYEDVRYSECTWYNLLGRRVDGPNQGNFKDVAPLKYTIGRNGKMHDISPFFLIEESV